MFHFDVLANPCEQLVCVLPDCDGQGSPASLSNMHKRARKSRRVRQFQQSLLHLQGRDNFWMKYLVALDTNNTSASGIPLC